MAKVRSTMREVAKAKNDELRDAMQVAIADGRLTVRQMTPREREASDAHRAAGASERLARASRRRPLITDRG